MKKLVACLALAAGFSACAYEYDVREPSIKPQYKGARQGVWTLDWEAALAKAKAEGKCTLVLFTGSWWCPYCHTIEDTVLTGDKWRAYVAEKGFYLAELDYSYRYAVPEGQEWKSYYPDATEGWGFKCWYMNPDFLSENGIAVEQGLQLIQKEYLYQGEMALPGAAQFTMKTWDGSGEITYGRIAYAAIVVIGPDGVELGRVDFPWYNTKNVTPSEAQEFEIQSIEKILNGECTLCGDTITGTPDVSAAQVYTGWLVDADGGTVGMAEFRTSRRNSKGIVRVSGNVSVNGARKSFKTVAVQADSFKEPVEFANSDVTASVQFGQNGMKGTVEGDFGKLALSGGRDVFKARDPESSASAAKCPSGVWNLVVKSSDASASPFAGGYGTLSAQIKAKGAVSIKGTLGDGTKFSAKSKAIIGEKGISCVPVRADLYGKKGGLGFVVWFKEGRLFSAEDISKWVAAGKNGSFETAVGILSTTSPGAGSVDGEVDFVMSGFDDSTLIKGRPVVVDPTSDIVEVKKLGWKGTEQTRFAARCSAKTGELSGSMVFYTGTDRALSKEKATFSGIVMGGTGYGSVLVKGVGSWAAKLTACGSCSD